MLSRSGRWDQIPKTSLCWDKLHEDMAGRLPEVSSNPLERHRTIGSWSELLCRTAVSWSGFRGVRLARRLRVPSSRTQKLDCARPLPSSLRVSSSNACLGSIDRCMHLILGLSLVPYEFQLLIVRKLRWIFEQYGGRTNFTCRANWSITAPINVICDPLV